MKSNVASARRALVFECFALYLKADFRTKNIANLIKEGWSLKTNPYTLLLSYHYPHLKTLVIFLKINFPTP